jgi:hypothetical protein
MSPLVSLKMDPANVSHEVSLRMQERMEIPIRMAVKGDKKKSTLSDLQWNT